MFLLEKCGVGFAQHLKAQSTVLNKGDFKDLESSIVDRARPKAAQQRVQLVFLEAGEDEHHRHAG